MSVSTTILTSIAESVVDVSVAAGGILLLAATVFIIKTHKITIARRIDPGNGWVTATGKDYPRGSRAYKKEMEARRDDIAYAKRGGRMPDSFFTNGMSKAAKANYYKNKASKAANKKPYKKKPFTRSQRCLSARFSYFKGARGQDKSYQKWSSKPESQRSQIIRPMSSKECRDAGLPMSSRRPSSDTPW